MHPGKRLVGKVAIVTGGASGIGAETARVFALHGAKVLLTDSNAALGKSVAGVPSFLEKYKDQIEANKSFPSPFDIVPLELKVLVQSFETIEEEERALDRARKQIKERDEFEAFEQAAIDLIRLDRY